MDESRALRVFSFKEQDVRVVEVNGEPWWVAKDVVNAGYPFHVTSGS